MNKILSSRRAFSLVELLVALSILAVVAAIIVPRFLNVREEAVRVTADAQVEEIQNIFRQWRALGGRENTAVAWQIVRFLCEPGVQGDNDRNAASALGAPNGPGGVANPCRDSINSFGSYTVGLTATVTDIAALTAATPDGLLRNTAAIATPAIPANSLIYKQGNYVHVITATGTGDNLAFTLGAQQTI